MVVPVSRNEYLCRKEDTERHVIFLDIEGVLQPCNSQKRFQHNITQTQINVAKLMKDDAYLELDRHDIAAVYYDWSERAVGNLKKLLSDCDAEIVISSDWKRTKSLEEQVPALNERKRRMLFYASDIFWGRRKLS